MSRRGLALLLGAWPVVAMLGRAAHAAAPTFVMLEYEVTPEASSCPDVEEFRAAVARQLHYDPFRPAADRRVAVQIARKDGGFDGRIRWTDADGRWAGDRRLSSRRSDCAEIASSLAFSVAVQVQLLATFAPPTPEPAPPAAAPAPPPAAPIVVPPPSPAVVASPSAAAPNPAPRRVTLSAGFGPALALGVAPETTGLARLFASGRLTRFSLEIALDAAWPATRHEAGGPGFTLERFAGGAAACGHAGALAACATGTLGILRARGNGVDAPATSSGLFSQAGARLAATSDFGGRYFASARLDALVMLSPWTVNVNEAPAWTTPRVAALMGVDVGARFF